MIPKDITHEIDRLSTAQRDLIRAHLVVEKESFEDLIKATQMSISRTQEVIDYIDET